MSEFPSWGGTLCKKCNHKRTKIWAKKSGYKARWQIKRRLEMRAIIIAAKNMPCADCKIKYIQEAMEFDHARGTKLFEISLAVRLCKSLTVLQAEISKCDLVCANCHAMRTFNRGHGQIPTKRTRNMSKILRRRHLRQIAQSAKSIPCSDCKLQWHYCQKEFDHLSDKIKCINALISLSSTTDEILLKEIAKCDVVCKNCHRKRTFT